MIPQELSNVFLKNSLGGPVHCTYIYDPPSFTFCDVKSNESQVWESTILDNGTQN